MEDLWRTVKLELEPVAPATRPSFTSLQPLHKLTAKGQTSRGTTALPSAPVGLAQKSQPLIQGLKLPNALECGLGVKTRLERAGPNGHRVLLHKNYLVSQVALKMSHQA